jgi:hypothetical protein
MARTIFFISLIQVWSSKSVKYLAHSDLQMQLAAIYTAADIARKSRVKSREYAIYCVKGVYGDIT